ncbi:putative nucleoprotein [Hubei dimarhabdovirus virus 2]|uniref:putative nucleoprotein n=1 Tax=Hubei dimarhabdovirus virus 2 TaxID=1922867 RepID=UPI00090B7861|nr:putative nucleoprotein [Hubei dimarhabdovirus virus 2]APG78719.1 putative nucleoprotein [Hubei dimarhabdovirus virus 2]
MNSLFHVKTGERYSIVLPEITVPSQYPSEWFQNNKGRKPIVRFNKGKISLDKLTKAVMSGIDGGTLNVEIVKYFIHTYMSAEVEESPGNWESFGVTIAGEGDDVTPWSLVEVVTTDTTIPNVQENKVEPGDEEWIIMLLLSASRLVNIPVQTYFESLRDRIFKLMKNAGCKLGTFPPPSLYDTWPLDEGYAKMIAAIDMFYSKFPARPGSILRICTLRSRFKDCASLLSVGYISDLLNLTNESAFLDWIWTEKIASEMIRMLHPNEEVVKNDSYFPYQTDFRLVNKTYYSASKNPQIYFLIHAVGTLLSSTRSKNAKFLSDSNIVNNIQCAKIMAYAFSTIFTMSKAFTADGKPVETDSGEGEETIASAPETTSGRDWFIYMSTMNFQLTKPMIEFVERAKRSLGETRADTIGDYVKNNF